MRCVMPRVLFASWVALVLILCPLARAIQSVVRTYLGNPAVFAAIAATIAILGALTVRHARKQRCSTRQLLLALAAVALFLAAAASRRTDPEEAFHLIEYGVMSALCLFALDPRRESAWSPLAASALTGSIGVCEELLQWLLPNRFFDFRDIELNIIAAVLAQVLLLATFRRTDRGCRFGRPSRAECDAPALLVALLLLCTLLTPSRILALAHLLPEAQGLTNEAVIEFGTAHQLHSWIQFPSRFSEQELASRDRAEGDQIAQLLTTAPESWGTFLSVHSAIRTPYLHEVAVHLFRRNRYLEILTQLPTERSNAEIAYAEETILRERFPHASGTTRLSEERYQQLHQLLGKPDHYLSPVSDSLIISISPAALHGALAVILAFLLVVRFQLPRSAQ